MIDNIKLSFLWLRDLVNTIRIGDVGMVSVTVCITILGKICTGLIPIIAVVAGLYQLQIFRTRLKTERVEYDHACHPKDEKL